MPAHPYLKLMEQFLEDAKKTEHPEKLWRYRAIGSESESDGWIPCVNIPQWSLDFEYSRRPASLNGHEYPLPETVPPAYGSTYYLPDLTFADFADSHVWRDAPFDQQMLSRGLVHLTQEAAGAHTKAIILAGGGTL